MFIPKLTILTVINAVWRNDVMVNRELLYTKTYIKTNKLRLWKSCWMRRSLNIKPNLGILFDEGKFCVHIHPYIIRSELILVKGSGLLQTWHALHKDAPLRALSHIWRETCLHHSFPFFSLYLYPLSRKIWYFSMFTQLHYTGITNSCNNSD